MTEPHCLRIDGEFTIYRAVELQSALKAALAGVPDGADLEVDLSAVSEMDSAGVQLLVAARASARAAGCELRLSGRSPAVDEVFRTLRLAAHFAAMPPLAAPHPLSREP